MVQTLEREVSKKMTGGQVIMETLYANRVETIFGYPGGAIMPTYDALFGYRDVFRHILGRHEQGSIHAAEAWARIKGKPGVVLATSGPGALNLVTGLNNAKMDSTPIVAITGQVAKPLIGTQAFQEADVVNTVRTNVKEVFQIQNGQEIQGVVNKAFRIATEGRPGPVLIDIPKNIQAEETDYYPGRNPKGPGLFQEKEQPELSSEALSQLQQAADLLNLSKKPLVLAGHGVLISGAMPELKALAEKAGIPIANTLHGLSSFPTEHPLFVGMVGMHGRYGANTLTNVADVILAIGMRFDDRVTGKLSEYAKQAKIIHIDIDKDQLNRLVKSEIAINADAKSALSVLLEQVATGEHPEWLEQFKKFNDIEDEVVTKKVLSGDTPDLTMSEVVASISDKTDGKAIIVADVGQHQMVAAQRSTFRKPYSFITSGGMGTMGFALPAAIGAKIAAPNREVVAVIGDGSFQMTIQELGVILQEDLLGVKLVILNNSFLGMVRQWQDFFHGGRRSFVDMVNPDFVTVASGYNIPGERVDERRKLDNALTRMLAADSAYLLDVKVEKEENVFPMLPPGVAVDQGRLS